MKKFAAAAVLFAIATSLTAFAEPDILKSSDGAFGYTPYGTITSYYGEKNVYVPSEIDGTKINEIGVMAFYDLDISAVYIDDGIETINTNAFEGSNAFYVYIPKSVKTVGERAFSNCASLSETALNSESVEFDADVFSGTGFIQFNIPCTVNEDELRQKILTAKGDNNFDFVKIHAALVESMTEKDVFGENMIRCEDCDFIGSKYLDNADLPFEDVQKDAWYSPYVGIAYKLGILNGKSETVFDPDAGMTCAEAVKIAACIHEYQTTQLINPDCIEYDTWYEPYFNYCCNTGIIEDYITFEPNEKVTRAQMAYLFSRCDADLYEVNPNVPLTDIPDVHDTTAFAYEILELYRRGVAAGSDEYMTFYPDAQVKRSEAAAFISRILCTDMRIKLPKG